jgi:cytochrome c oxidase assembly protein subunit 15
MFKNLVAFCILLTLVVVVLGAYVRLSDAGLGCPDWPGCYGNLIIDEAPSGVEQANQAFPDRPFEASKAWKEMVHRYFASTLGFVILVLTLIAWRKPELEQRGKTTFLLLLVMFQGALGMWTVTLLVKPVIVMSHLLGGLATLSLLLWLYLDVSSVLRRRSLQNFDRRTSRPPIGLRFFAVLSLLVLLSQIALGGWTSTNYAALSCPSFPTCFGSGWQPDVDYREGFVLWRGLGVDYEFGVLKNEARAAIHWVHRIGALVTAVVLSLLSIFLFASRYRKEAFFVFILLGAQVTLGILNVVLSLPLHVAVAHNGFAALLLLSLVHVNFRLRLN